MVVDLRLPNITGRSDSEKIQQLTKYIYQLTEQLNYSFNAIEMPNQTMSNTSKSDSSASQSEDEKLLASYQVIKDMIVKSADFTQAFYEEMKTELSGTYLAISDFGTYLENTSVEIEGNSVGFTQLYSYSAGIKSDFGDFSVDNSTYIKTGLLYYRSGSPIYGVAIGDLTSTIDSAGRTVLDRSGFLTTYTSSAITFWHDDEEIASIEPDEIYFPSGILHAENAWISGTINASGGSIAGWTIDGTDIKKSVTSGGTTHQAIMSAPLSITTTPANNVAFGVKVGSSWKTYMSYTGRFYAKDAVIEGDITATSGSFSGSINASGGTIGGWSISPYYIHSPSGKRGSWRIRELGTGDWSQIQNGYVFSVLTIDGLKSYFATTNTFPTTEINENLLRDPEDIEIAGPWID